MSTQVSTSRSQMCASNSGALRNNQNKTIQDTANIQPDKSYLMSALNNGRISLSLSPLLGCDYIFIHHEPLDPLAKPEGLQSLFTDILSLLATNPKQSIFISVTSAFNEEKKFTRYDFVWNNQRPENILLSPVDQPEQQEFIGMIHNCSSPV